MKGNVHDTRVRSPHQLLWHILPPLIMTGILTIALLPFRPHLDPVNMALFYLIPVLVAAMKWGTTSAMLTALAGILAFDIFFIPPVHRLTVHDTKYIITFLIFLCVALSTSSLAARLREQISEVRKRQAQMEVLHALANDLATALDLEQVLDITSHHIAEFFQIPCVVFLPTPSVTTGNLKLLATSHSDLCIGDKELRAAKLSFEKGTPSGKGTNVDEDIDGLFYPLRTMGRTIGVLGLVPITAKQTINHIKQLESMVGLGAVAIERATLTLQAAETRWIVESERLYSSIFNSVSHELKTPLALMMAAITSLQDEDITRSEILRKELLETSIEQGNRMDRLLNNLLDMARLDSGRMQLTRSWVYVNELVDIALEKTKASLGDRPVYTHIDLDLPPIFVDGVLIEQVLVNLIDNAIKYSPSGSSIDIRTSLVCDDVLIQVSDGGPGIPEDDLPKIFEKFYRIQDNLSGRGGTGLGLSICKGIVEVHGGSIWASNKEKKGLTVNVTLAIEPKDEDGGSRG